LSECPAPANTFHQQMKSFWSEMQEQKHSCPPTNNQ